MASAYGPRRKYNAGPNRSTTETKFDFNEDVFDFPESDGERNATPRARGSVKSKTSVKKAANPRKRTPSVRSTTTSESDNPVPLVKSRGSSRQASHDDAAAFDFPGSAGEGRKAKKTKRGMDSISEATGTARKGKEILAKANAEASKKRKREEPASTHKSRDVIKPVSPKRKSPPPKAGKSLPLGNSKPKILKKVVQVEIPRRAQAAPKRPAQDAITSPPPKSDRITRSRSRSQTPAFNFDTPTTPTTPRNRLPRGTPSPSRNPETPRTATKIGAMTPKQKGMWSKLLSDDTPENIQLSALKLTPKPAPVPAEEYDEPTTKRIRLVDMLQISGRANDSGSDDSEEESFEADEIVHESQVSRTSHSAHMSRAKTRYGQQRSYIADQDENVIFDMMLEDSARNEATQRSRDEFDMDDDEDDGSQQLRSMQDLRAAGQKQRMLHELQSLISGVKGEVVSSMSAQRFDLLELAGKLVDQNTAQAFLDHGLERQLLEKFSDSSDSIYNFLSTALLVFIIKHIGNLASLRAIFRSGWLQRMFELLELEQDVARMVKDRKWNMSKIAQSSVVEFQDVLLKPEWWAEGTVPEVLTPNVLALRAIELLVRRMRELGSEDALLDEKRVLSLLNYSDAESSFAQKTMVLSCLESNSVGGLSGRGAMTSKCLSRLCGHLASILSMKESDFTIRNLALRLSLNMTNNHGGACSMFSTKAFVAALVGLIIRDFGKLNEQGAQQGENYVKVLDELILTLGAMINLAELSDAARILVLDQDGGSVLKEVVNIFQTGLVRTEEADSVEASQANVPYGYLALTLVNLCQNDTVRTRILSLMPVAQLDRLIQAAEEFISIHQRTDQEIRKAVMGGADEDDSLEEESVENMAGDGYTNRLLGMVRRLKMIKAES
jgi:hypothetical protein